MASLRAFAEAVAQRVGTAMAVTPAELQDVTVTKMGQDGLCHEGWGVTGQGQGFVLALRVGHWSPLIPEIMSPQA